MEAIKNKLKQDMQGFNPDKIKAIAIDIDGTLINANIECTPRTEKAIKDLIKTGKEVYIVTGRATHSAMSFAKQVAIPNYMVNFNGAGVYNFQTQQMELEYNIPTEVSQQVIALARKHKIMTMAYTNDSFYYEYENDYLKRYLERVSSDCKKVSYDDIDISGIKKYFMMSNKETIDELHQEFTDLLGDKVSLLVTTPQVHNLYKSDSPAYCIEVMAKDVNKGHALRDLLAHQHINMDEVVAFGDDNNDIEMLSMVGWGVAMNNAKPAVKEAARLETLSNQDEGVAYFIETYLLNN